MLKIQLFLWKSVLYRTALLGMLFSLLISPLALADTPPDPKEQSVPVQLRLIRETLIVMEERLAQQMSDMEANLGTQMTEMEGRLNSTMADIQSSVSVGNGKLDDLQASANDIYDAVTAVNIDLTTTLCFDAGAKFEGGVGIHDEVGIGWPNVLSAKAILQGEGAIGGELAVSSQICVQVPLYSVASYEQLFDNGDEFDDLIAAIALPSQNVVPLIAEVYTELMPTPDEAFLAMSNVLVASTGYDIYTGTVGTPNPAALLRPDVLLEPVIPQAAVDFILQVPQALTEALLDPCGALEATPIGASLAGRSDVQFLCSAHADALQALMPAINVAISVIDAIFDFLDPAHLFH